MITSNNFIIRKISQNFMKINKIRTVVCFGMNPLNGGKRVKALSLQEPGSGQIQCTPWRNFAPFTTSTFIDIHASAQAWENAGDRQWVRDT